MDFEAGNAWFQGIDRHDSVIPALTKKLGPWRLPRAFFSDVERAGYWEAETRSLLTSPDGARVSGVNKNDCETQFLFRGAPNNLSGPIHVPREQAIFGLSLEVSQPSQE